MEVDLASDDDDPVVAEYNVYLTPEVKNQLYLLQYPNRKRAEAYNYENKTSPSELRVKPKSGFLEVDIGVSTSANFDKLKGMQWGAAMKHARDSKTRGFGMSAGLGKGSEGSEMMKVLVSGGKDRGEDPEKMLSEFDARKERGGVLVKQTLGGMIKRPENDRPWNMIGVFRGNELHLTELTGTAQLRPQFHHIDAQAAITRHNLRSANGPIKPAQPLSLSIVQKTKDDSGLSVASKAMDDWLNEVADENWRKLVYRDESEEESWALYEKVLTIKDVGETAPLKSQWKVDQYLDWIRVGTEPPEEKDKDKKVSKKPEIARKKSGKEKIAAAGPFKK